MPGNRLALDLEFLANDNPLLGLAGSMEDYEGPVEDASVGPNRKELHSVFVVAKQEAATFVHQRARVAGSCDALIRPSREILRTERMRARGGDR